MKYKRLGFKKKPITTHGSPLLQQHSDLEQNQQVVSWEQAVKAYDKLSIDGFINGRLSGGTTVL
jgi:hypothetical protein